MNIKAIIASLVLGSSSVALAAPAVTVTARGSIGATVVRDHRAVADEDCDPEVTYPGQPVYGQPVYGQPVYEQPVYEQPVYGQPAYGQPVYGQPVYGQPVYSPPIWQGPARHEVTLADGMHFANDGRTFITVGSQYGRFGALTISAAGGRSYIEQVYVQFDNGQEQVMRGLNRTLTGSARLTLDLDGNRRGIKRIVVYGKEINGGFRRADGAFTVTAI